MLGIWGLYIHAYTNELYDGRKEKSGLDTPSNPLYNNKYSIKHEVILP